MGRDQPGTGHHASTPQRRSPARLERPVRADPAAPGQPLRHVRDHWAGRGAPYPCPQRPGPPGGSGHSLHGPTGWQHAAARPSSSAAHATRASTAEALHGNHDEHWRAEMLGKRASPVRREAVRKGPSWHLAGGPPYCPSGSDRGPPGKGPAPQVPRRRPTGVSSCWRRPGWRCSWSTRPRPGTCPAARKRTNWTRSGWPG